MLLQQSLVDIPKIPKEVYLGVGALASAYCRAHNCHVGKNEGVVAVSNKFAAKLNCKAKGKVRDMAELLVSFVGV